MKLFAIVRGTVYIEGMETRSGLTEEGQKHPLIAYSIKFWRVVWPSLEVTTVFLTPNCSKVTLVVSYLPRLPWLPAIMGTGFWYWCHKLMVAVLDWQWGNTLGQLRHKNMFINGEKYVCRRGGVLQLQGRVRVLCGSISVTYYVVVGQEVGKSIQASGRLTICLYVLRKSRHVTTLVPTLPLLILAINEWYILRNSLT